MTTLCFTICSNNYLAQAKSLGDSFITHHPEHQFIICLVDELSEHIDYSYFNPHQLLLVAEVPVLGFKEMIYKYNITELNTAVKPFVFKYLFDIHPETATIIYLDPDIIVYDAFNEIENAGIENNFILTPHFTTAINDPFQLSEEAILNCGLYNLGFLCLKRRGRVFEFLDWWMERLKDRCFINMEKGWFVDQIWINFVPLYYEGALILRHSGYNMAYWNLHERKLENRGGKYYVNETYPLVFYHFSGYNVLSPEGISKYQDRYTFESRPEMSTLFEEYTNTVLQNKQEQFSIILCYYTELRREAEEAAAAAEAAAVAAAIAAAEYEAQLIAEMEEQARQLEELKNRKKPSFKVRTKNTLRRILHLNN